MPEDAANQFLFLNLTTPVSGTLREVIGNNNATREKAYLNGLGMKKGEYGGVSMIPRTGLEVVQDYNI